MNNKKIYTNLVGGFIAISFLVGIFVVNISLTNKKIEKDGRYIVFGKENVIAVFEDKLAIKIPYEIQLNKDEKIGDAVKNRRYDEVLENLNGILPEKIEKYHIVKYGKLELGVENSRNIVETIVDDKRYILHSSVEPMFKELYKRESKEELPYGDIIVDVLNANGKTGYARNIGEKLKGKYGVKYNASNYEKNSDESYIVVNDLGKKQVEELVMALNEKYFKIKNVSTMPTLANVVFIIGKEQNPTMEIVVSGEGSEKDNVVKKLKKNGYKKIKEEKNKKESEEKIEYNSEDYYIAYKIGEKIGIKNLVETKENKNKIKIHLKNK